MVASLLLLSLLVLMGVPVAWPFRAALENALPAAEDADVTVPGGGTTSMTPLVHQWCSMFQAVKQDRYFPYAMVGSAVGNDAVRDGQLTWAATMIEPSPAPTVMTFPWLDAPIVIVYNLPTLVAPLRLSVDAVALIFAGNITRWNDHRICDANAEACSLLPDADIVLVLVEDGGSTMAFTGALQHRATPGYWPLGRVAKWPQRNGTAIMVPAMRAGATISVLPHTISYMCKLWSGIFMLQSASLGDAATGTALTAASANATWPLIARHYGLINLRAPCEQLSHVLRFVRWALLDPMARNIARNLGFLVRPLRDVEALVANLTAGVLCMDSSEPLLRVSTEDLPMAPFAAMMVVGGLSAVASSAVFCALLVLLKRAQRLLPTDALFLSCTQGAVVLLALSSFAWSLLRNTAWGCAMLPWVALLPLSLLVGTIVGRLLQVMTFYRAKETLTNRRLLWRFLAGFASLVGVQLLLLVMLTASRARPVTTVRLLDWIDLVGQPVCVPGAPHGQVFVWVSVAINLVFALGGILVLVVGWKFIPIVSESRWLFLALYTCIIRGLFILLLLPAISLSLSTQLAIVGWLSVFLSLFWIPIYVSKLLHLRHERDHKAATRSLDSSVSATGPRQRRVDISMSSDMDIHGVAEYAYAVGASATAVAMVEYPPHVLWQQTVVAASHGPVTMEPAADVVTGLVNINL